MELVITRPLWLVALAVLPLVVYYGCRSLVRFARWQCLASLAIRGLLLVVLAVALCGIQARTTSRQLFVVFAVDESLSISDASRKAAAAFLAEARKHAGDHRLAFLPFAVEPGAVADSLPAGLPQRRDGTNLASAIAAAEAATASGCVPRVVLLSDGNQTAGDALAAAEAGTMPVWIVPLPGRPQHEVYVSAVEAKAEVLEGEPFEVDVIVQSRRGGDGSVQLFETDEPVVRRRKDLAEGENRLRFRHAVTGKSEATLTAELQGFKDTLAENNRLSALALVAGRPRVLVIEGQPESAGHLAAALRQHSIDVDLGPPEKMPDGDARLRDYELLILSDVPAASLPIQQMQLIQRYVGHLGGGLIVIGGYRSFTPGGYRGSTLEEILPVRSHVREDKPKPSLAMVLLIDRSGSMKGERIELAKQATRQAVEKLRPSDQVGIIAMADRSDWVSPIRPCSDEPQILRRIDTITAGGGTNLYPAMDKAYLALREAFADRKHMIVLSDGLSHPGDFEALTRQIAASGITVSTVAVESPSVGHPEGEPNGRAAAELLQDIARCGKGHYYHCDQAADVPEIFVLEAAAAGKVGIAEGPFLPKPIAAARPSQHLPERPSDGRLVGLDFDKPPLLWGYAETRLKPNSQLLLAAKDGDPLLACWRYGSGVSAAFTSGVGGRWAEEWLTWSGFGPFWAELVRHVMRKGDPPAACVLRVQRKNHQAQVILDAIDPNGRYVNGAEPTLEVLDPKGQTHTTRMVQIAPGLYAAELATPTAGAYMLDWTLIDRGRATCVGRRGLVTGYPDELRLKPANEDLLRAVAGTTGGRYDPGPEEVFAPPERTVRRTVSLRPYLLGAAVLIFLIDVALKRIDLTRQRPSPQYE